MWDIPDLAWVRVELLCYEYTKQFSTDFEHHIGNWGAPCHDQFTNPRPDLYLEFNYRIWYCNKLWDIILRDSMILWTKLHLNSSITIG